MPPIEPYNQLRILNLILSFFIFIDLWENFQQKLQNLVCFLSKTRNLSYLYSIYRSCTRRLRSALKWKRIVRNATTSTYIILISFRPERFSLKQYECVLYDLMSILICLTMIWNKRNNTAGLYHVETACDKLKQHHEEAERKKKNMEMGIDNDKSSSIKISLIFGFDVKSQMCTAVWRNDQLSERVRMK